MMVERKHIRVFSSLTHFHSRDVWCYGIIGNQTYLQKHGYEKLLFRKFYKILDSCKESVLEKRMVFPGYWVVFLKKGHNLPLKLFDVDVEFNMSATTCGNCEHFCCYARYCFKRGKFVSKPNNFTKCKDYSEATNKPEGLPYV